jgi:di/tricarboxylate transporter
MTISQWFIITVISIPLVLVIIGRLRMDIAALSIPLMLAVGQLSGLSVFGPTGQGEWAARAFSGFSEEAVITLVGVFILTAALDKSGFARWVSRQLLRIGGNSVRKMIFLFASTAAFLSLFMNDVAAAAFLIPSVLDVSKRTGINPGKLLIPVSYGSLLGGMATYFATANILANSLLTSASPPQEPLSVLAFFPTGGLIAISGILYLTFLGERLLPAREHDGGRFDKKLTGSELEKIYDLNEQTWKITIEKKGALCGRTLKDIGLGENYGLVLAAIRNGKRSLLLPDPKMTLKPGNQLLVIGHQDRVKNLACEGVRVEADEKADSLSKRGLAIFELLVMSRSSAIGKNLKDLNFRQQYGWSVIALRRGDSNYRTDVGSMKLAIGDTLLVVGETARKESINLERDFILLESSPSDQPVRVKEAIFSIGLLVAAVVAAVLGMPIYISVLAAAMIAIFSGAIKMQEAYRAIEWQVIFVVGGMYSISLALVHSGLAASAGSILARSADLFGPIGLAGSSFLIASILSQIMGGQFEMLMTGPIAISAANQYGVIPQAIVLAVAIGCSNSFLTPMAHPANLLMMAPGGYKFSDFLRIGWRMFLLAFVMLLVGMILFWGMEIGPFS